MWYTRTYGDGARFIEADKFTGKKEGYTYRKGLRGSGYYKVKKSAAKTAPARKTEAKAAPKVDKKARTEPQKEPDAQDLLDFGGAIFGAALNLGGQAISAAADAVTSDDAPPAQASIYDGESKEGESEDADAQDVIAAELAEKEEAEVEEEEAAFIAAPRFAGKKPGYVFKSGPEGKGYYNRAFTWEYE